MSSFYFIRLFYAKYTLNMPMISGMLPDDLRLHLLAMLRIISGRILTLDVETHRRQLQGLADRPS
jgi:hypothetical protein